MTDAAMRLEFGRLIRDQRAAQGTAGSFAALARSQDRREQTMLPFEMLATNVGNLIRTKLNDLVVAVVGGVKEIPGLRGAMERIEEAMKAEGDTGTTEKLFDHLKEVAREARDPKAKRRL